MGTENIFAERLHILRKAAKVSSYVLADAVGISRPAISQFENKANMPTVQTLVKLCEYFNVSSDYLLGLSDTPERR